MNRHPAERDTAHSGGLSQNGATEESAVGVLKAIRAFFGGSDLRLTVDGLCDPDLIVQLGVAPLRIDLMSSISGINSFEDAWPKRTIGKYGETDVSYISLDDLIRNKEKRIENRIKLI